MRVKTFVDLASGVAVIIASGALVFTLIMRSANRAPVEERIQHVSGTLTADHVTNVIGTGPIAIVEFSDFQCPFCATHANNTFPEIRRTLIDSGKVRYVVVNFPIERIHPRAIAGAEAAECAAREGKYWSLRERLFTHTADLYDQVIMSEAAALGLREEVFGQCMRQHETVMRIRRDQEEGRRLGVVGTPAFFVGTARADGGIDLITRIRGAVPAAVFAQEVSRVQADRFQSDRS